METDRFLYRLASGDDVDIHDFIACWHDLSETDPEAKKELHEFLGMTWEQYKTWLEEDWFDFEPTFPIRRHRFVKGKPYGYGKFRCARCYLIQQGPGTLHDVSHLENRAPDARVE